VFLVSIFVSVPVQFKCDLLGVSPSESVPVRLVLSRYPSSSFSTVRLFRSPDSGLSLFSASFLSSMYPDMPDGYAGWLLRHLKSKPLCLYSSILVLILCPFGLPLSSVMSVPSLKFIHVSASVQCPVVASSIRVPLPSILVFAFVSGFQSALQSVFQSVFSHSELVSDLLQTLFEFFGFQFSVSVSVLRLSSSASRFRIQIPVHPCLSVIV
jgi:hypothetical protein